MYESEVREKGLEAASSVHVRAIAVTRSLQLLCLATDGPCKIGHITISSFMRKELTRPHPSLRVCGQKWVSEVLFSLMVEPMISR